MATARRPRRRKELVVELNDLRAEAQGPGYTLKEDTFERLPDGREALVGRAGQTIPIALAQRLGLIKPGPDQQGASLKDRRAAREAADRKVPTPTLDILAQSPGSPEDAEPRPEIFTRPAATESRPRGRATGEKTAGDEKPATKPEAKG